MPSRKNTAERYKKYLRLFIFPLLVLFSACGPRSGIHDDDAETTQAGSDQFFCGNAAMDEANYSWAEKVLNIRGDGQRGSKLFKQNCAVCHDIMDRRFTGPGLKGVYSRIPEPKGEWLKSYILNSVKVDESGDAYAKKLRQNYPKDTMTVFEGYLPEKDLNDIIIYVVGSAR